jgi:hypothetical protein
VPRPTKRLLQQLQQHPQLSNLEIDDEDYDEYDDSIVFGRNLQSRKFGNLVDNPDDEPLSEYVTVRLAVARAKAMQKYREVWG